jgi:hypothetical protein
VEARMSSKTLIEFIAKHLSLTKRVKFEVNNKKKKKEMI